MANRSTSRQSVRPRSKQPPPLPGESVDDYFAAARPPSVNQQTLIPPPPSVLHRPDEPELPSSHLPSAPRVPEFREPAVGSRRTASARPPAPSKPPPAFYAAAAPTHSPRGLPPPPPTPARHRSEMLSAGDDEVTATYEPEHLAPQVSATPAAARTWNSLETLRPSAVSVPPSERSAHPIRRTFDYKWLAIAAAVVIGVSAIALQLTPKSGDLVVHVMGPSGAAVERVNVYVNEELACDQAPCPLKGLEGKGHLVSFEAVGFAQDAINRVAIRSSVPAASVSPATSSPAALSPSELPEAEAPGSKAPTGTEDQAEQDEATRSEPPTTEADERLNPSSPPAPTRRRFPSTVDSEREPPAKRPSKPQMAKGKGVFNIYSTPSASVIIDGRPRGTTPATGIQVDAGKHLIILAHPLKGRKKYSASVAAGASRNINVEF